MHKIVEVSNDIWSAFYLDGKKICECERYEIDVLLRALGFSCEFREEFVESFPEDLEDLD